MMERSFSEALKQRRTYYSITNQSPISDQEIECIVNMTVRHVPSAFNSQTTRVVLLLGESHKKLWQIVKDALKKIVPAEAFAKTEEKIDHSFACGYGTVLFFEDQKVVKGLQEAFPSYQENFPGWSLQTSAMHQLFASCFKMSASVLPYNIIIRLLIIRCAVHGTCRNIGI